jgi:hypothetical protein
MFVTNLRDDSSKAWAFIKMLFGMNYGNVVYADSTGTDVNVVFEASMPNGVLADYEMGKLLVTSSRENTLYVLDYEPSTAKENRKPTKRIPIKMRDNITRAPDAKGEVLVASHPKLLKFLRHSKAPETAAPSLVLAVNYLGDSEPLVLFRDDGSSVSAASTGLIHDGYVYIGQVFKAGVYRCRLD